MVILFSTYNVLGGAWSVWCGRRGMERECEAAGRVEELLQSVQVFPLVG